MLRSPQDPGTVARAWEDGRIAPLSNAPDVDAERIASCANIVALAEVEQVQAASNTGADNRDLRAHDR